ncbi:hypothetical protein N9O61_04950 [Octadecabacter sp.]|nr:hypothetical protein [Octadecabacter sp.]
MRIYLFPAILFAVSGCVSEPSSVDTFNAQPQADRRAAIDSCLAQVGRPAAPDGPLRIEPPLSPEEGSIFAACLTG